MARKFVPCPTERDEQNKESTEVFRSVAYWRSLLNIEPWEDASNFEACSYVLWPNSGSYRPARIIAKELARELSQDQDAARVLRLTAELYRTMIAEESYFEVGQRPHHPSDGHEC